MKRELMRQLWAWLEKQKPRKKVGYTVFDSPVTVRKDDTITHQYWLKIPAGENQ